MAKPIIITRADKGAALTWEEGDANFINLQNAALPQGGSTGQVLVKTSSLDYEAEFQTVSTNLVSDTSPQLGGVLDMNGHSIESIDAATPVTISSGASVLTVGMANTVSDQPARIALSSEAVAILGQQGVDLISNTIVGINAPIVLIKNMQWPGADGTAGQVLGTDGGSNLVWQTPIVINDASTTSTTEAWSAYKIDQTISDSQTATLGEVNTILGNLSYIANVVEDTTPQLGGTLDTNGYPIYGSNSVVIQGGLADSIALGGGGVSIKANGDITKIVLQETAGFGNITATANGVISVNTTDMLSLMGSQVRINNLFYPTADGTTGQVLATNGTATLSWVDPDTGPQGAVGFTGSQGIQGIQGETGAQGPIGFTGSQGIQGIQGIQGAVGFTGSQGVAGADGAQGPIGFTGFTGSQGVAGADGAQGIIGFTGSQGIQGVAGADGAQGPIGFTGSKGDSGTNGIDGAQGPIGFTGSQGIAGADGAQGIQGVAGPIGFTGSQGIQGVAGVAGADGAQGIQGPIGFTGSQGIAGTNGIDGAPGPIGFTGSKGDSGSQGPIGFTGSAAAGGVTINDAATTSTTETWSANKLYTTLGDIQTALTAIIG